MRFTQGFEITRWDQSTYDEGDAGVVLGKAVVHKTFADGELDGTSTAELLMVGTADGPAAYTAVFEHDDAGPRVTLDLDVPGAP